MQMNGINELLPSSNTGSSKSIQGEELARRLSMYMHIQTYRLCLPVLRRIRQRRLYLQCSIGNRTNQNRFLLQSVRHSKAYFINSRWLFFTSDQNHVCADLVRETVFRILYLAVGVIPSGAGFEFPGFGGKSAPDFSSASSELYDQCGRRIRIYLLGHSISSETVVRDYRITYKACSQQDYFAGSTFGSSNSERWEYIRKLVDKSLRNCRGGTLRPMSASLWSATKTQQAE